MADEQRLTEPDWNAFPDAHWFHPETDDKWASYYRMESNSKLYRKIPQVDEVDCWKHLPMGNVGYRRFCERVATLKLIQNPNTYTPGEGENSWLNTPA